MFSDMLEYRSYVQSSINLYHRIFKDTVARALEWIVPISIPPIAVDYVIACSLCFVVLNWSKRRATGQDHLTGLIPFGHIFFVYLGSALRRPQPVKEKGPLPIWVEMPLTIVLMLVKAIGFAFTYLFGPLTLLFLIDGGVLDLMDRGMLWGR